MDLDAHIEIVTSWLDCVHVESAPARTAEMREQNAQKDRAALSVGGGTESIALHESAHAAVACSLRLTVGRTCIRADESGSAAYEAAEVSAATTLTLVVATLAGVVSELIAGCHPWRQMQLAHSHDVLAARLRIMESQAIAPDWNVTIRTLVSLTFCSVLSRWDSISRVADALLAAGELDGQRVAALCSPGPRAAVGAQ
jgi:hypothetical protein